MRRVYASVLSMMYHQQNFILFTSMVQELLKLLTFLIMFLAIIMVNNDAELYCLGVFKWQGL